MSTDARAIRRVLVPLDGSERARRVLPAATALACQAHAGLELLTVQTAGGDWEHHLQPLAEALPLPDVDTTLVSSGPPDEAIADLADRLAGTVVGMATRARSGLSEVLLGSTAARVVRRTRSPVLLIGPYAHTPDPHRRYTHLAVCLSGSQRAERMLPLVQRWARQLRIPLTLVHGTAQDTPPGDRAPTERRLRDLADQAPDVDCPATVHIAPGPTPPTGVNAYLDRHPDCLALVSVRKGARLERLLPGGFTSDLVQRAPTPVVVITAAAAPTRPTETTPR